MTETPPNIVHAHADQVQRSINRRQGLCHCGKPRVSSEFCEEHWREANARNRQYRAARRRGESTAQERPPCPLSPAEIAAIRAAYGESRAAFSERVGCTYATIGKWERGERQPEPAFRDRLIALRAGPIPPPAPAMSPEEIAELRAAYGEPIAEFCWRVPTLPETFYHWETGRHRPNARTMRRLLDLWACRPERPRDPAPSLAPAEIKALRIAYGMTQLEFGRLVPCAERSVFDWEHGRDRPAPYNMRRLIELRDQLNAESPPS